MKIFFPFQTDTGFLGVTTFALKFKKGMEALGNEVFFEYRHEYDLLFMVVQAPFRHLIEAKRRKIPIVQRLDGLFYWSVSGWKYPLLNLKAMIIRHIFTDFSVYQSHYSKYLAEKFLGRKTPDPATIIYNGIDLDLFSPNGEKIESIRDTPNQQIFFSASAFRRSDQIIPLLEALRIYKEKYNRNFKALIAGPFRGEVSHIPSRYKNFKEIVFLGEKENFELPKYERASDIFIFTHLNPPCPNNIIEALGCGLPICGVADGSMPEIVREKGNALLIPASGNAFWKPRSYDVQAFAHNIHTLMSQRGRYARMSRVIAKERFSLDTMIREYDRVFRTLT